jgi:hypothetical protein
MMVMPFGVYFPKVCMFDCVPPQTLKEFHNIFVFYVRMQLKQDIKKKATSSHFIK